MPQLRTNKSYTLSTEDETRDFARQIAAMTQAGDVIFLEGPLGAGKTFFSQAFIQSLGHEGKVLSPTYSLVQSYTVKLQTQSAPSQLHHFDLYRLADPEELEFIGIRDYINPDYVCLIEWPSKGKGILPAPSVYIQLDYAPSNPEGRIAQVTYA